MKIVIDGRMIGWTGIGRYITELLKWLEQIDHNNQYVVLLQHQDWHKWQPSAPNFTKHEVNIMPYSLAEQFKLPGVIRGFKPDLTHFTSINSPFLSVGKRVTTVHDLTLIDYSVARGSTAKKLIYELKRLVLKAQVWEVLRRTSHVIADTEYGRNDLIKRGLKKSAHITAVHLGANFGLITKSKAGPANVQAPYLLYVGNYYGYKNIGRLVDALPAIVVKHPDMRLVLVGKEEEPLSQELLARAEVAEVKNRIHFTGFVPDSQLAWLYQNASLYVFPSLSEGFGLPGLEAMSYGAPVASSNATCLPEVYGEAAAYFDPNDTADIAKTINEVLGDPKFRAKLIKAGYEQVKKYSWERMAHQTLEVYKRALDKS